ncbi:EcsC family protein [Chachezhania sediminis]|uniref:EcsC family protein n=1 Tax=Chachezhania sediminis TaxID=2599291 RepID=UPI00131B10AC|nr:EcsC family protein [Chachezhania sediminis]
MSQALIQRPEVNDALVQSQLALLADRYRGASGPGLLMLNALGLKAETLIDRLPDGVRDRMGAITEAALRSSMKAAHFSRRAVPDKSPRTNALAAAAMGAAGGIGGLSTALIELPATTTMFLRSIQGVAVQHGFDPASEAVQFDCVRILADAGPLAEDDGADAGFYSARLTLTGSAVQSLVSRVLPRFSEAMGRKLATRTVPVLGAATGAATNFIYARYYQEMAHVGFALRRLSIEADISHSEIVDNFVDKLRASSR